MVIFKKNDLPSKVQVYESAEEETMANTLEKKNYLVPVILSETKSVNMLLFFK